MKKYLLVPVLVVLLCEALWPAPMWKDVSHRSEIPDVPFEKYSLPNGLEVILSEDHRLPLVAVNIWYHVGAVNERPGRTGFAHLFEHMMFQGSKHVEGDSHFKLLEGAGATGMNGTTEFDRTNYFETVPANEIELALWLESDRMGYLPDTLDQANLSNQQDVVRNERRQSIENQPYGIVEEAVYHLLFPKGHPYYGMVMGSHADIQAARLEDVRNFFQIYYAPNNATLAIVGDFDKSSVKGLVQKYFGPLRRGAAIPKISITTPAITSERRAVIEDRISLPKIDMGWLTSAIFKSGDAEADLSAQILGGGKSSRLYKKLVYDLQIAQNVLAGQQSALLGSIFEIEVTARPGHTPEEVEKALNAELEKFRSEGPTRTELERARNTIETNIVRRLENLGGFGGVADSLNRYNHYLGDPGYLKKDLARYDSATISSVRRFAQDQLRANARVVVYGVPGTPKLEADVATSKFDPSNAVSGGQGINEDQAWRAKPPKSAPAPPLQLPKPESFKLDNGLTVIHSYRPGLPMVSAELILRTGSDSNPITSPGLANFVAAMLDQGTGTRTALEIADAVAALGAALNTGSTMDASFISTSSLMKNFPAALRIVAELTLNPSFPQEEIERQRVSRLAQIVQRRDNAAVVSSQVMAAALYGPDHPYGYPEIGTEEFVKSASRDAMVAFWKQNFVANNAALIVVGNIARAELTALVNKEFGGWKPGTPAKPSLNAPRTSAAKIVLVDKPGAQQTYVRVARIGVPRSTPDFAALEILNAELGGLFSSRINLNLREEHGYTYGAASAFTYRKGPGPFLVVVPVRTDVTAPALAEIFKELERMMDGPMTADELSLSIDSQVRSLPGQFETSDDAAASYANIYLYDLGLDYYGKLPAQLRAVSAAQAQALAKKWLAPHEMTVIAVGDRSKIEPSLKALNLGQIEIREPDGRLRSESESR